MKVLLTGSAGFIGSHIAHHLLDRGDRVIGLDAFTAYYDPELKERRSSRLEEHSGFTLVRGDINVRRPAAVLRRNLRTDRHTAN